MKKSKSMKRVASKKERLNIEQGWRFKGAIVQRFAYRKELKNKLIVKIEIPKGTNFK